jgi:hypothetical protein
MTNKPVVNRLTPNALIADITGENASLKETNDVLQRENAQLRDENTQLKARLAAYEAQLGDGRDEESPEVVRHGLKGTYWSLEEDKQILTFALMVDPRHLRGRATYALANAVDVSRFQTFPIKVKKETLRTQPRPNIVYCLASELLYSYYYNGLKKKKNRDCEVFGKELMFADAFIGFVASKLNLFCALQVIRGSQVKENTFVLALGPKYAPCIIVIRHREQPFCMDNILIATHITAIAC